MIGDRPPKRYECCGLRQLRVSRLFIFYFLGGVRWIVNNFIGVYQVYGVYLYCN